MLEQFRTKNSPKLAENFSCESCLYQCSKKSDLIKHFSTTKHKNRTKIEHFRTSGDKIIKQNSEKLATKSPTTCFKCICGKEYKARNSLWYHKKKCYIYQNSLNEISIQPCSTDVITKEQLINMLLSNQEIMKSVVDNMPKMGNTQANNTNSFNNQTFNIQMFLNENCKNAMNLTDFIDSLPITNETYDNTIENGLTKTISNMVVNGLNNLDITDRPIHCTDSSRKVLYVKEANKWEKDNELLLILQGIKKIALKQRTMINKWKDSNKGWEGNENLQNKLTNLVCNSMTDIENDDKETNKIVKAISKKVYLNNDIKKNYLSNI